MRIGVVSDLHWVQEPPSSAAGWHGAGADFVGVLGRLSAALEHFSAAEVDVVAVCGDLVHHGDMESLSTVLGALARADASVIVVAGNHDVTEDPERLAEALAHLSEAGVFLATEAGDDIAGVRLAGAHVGESQAWFRARLASLPAVEARGADPLVVMSHYPVLSMAEEIAGHGLPYPGDLLDRTEFAEALAVRKGPTVILSGHVHVRASRTSGPLLQLSVAALVEAPYECAVVDLCATEGDAWTVTRSCIRLLGEPTPDEPVLSPDHETWSFEAGRWVSAAPRWPSDRSAFGEPIHAAAPPMDPRPRVDHPRAQ